MTPLDSLREVTRRVEMYGDRLGAIQAQSLHQARNNAPLVAYLRDLWGRPCACTHEDPRMCAASCDCSDGDEPGHIDACRAACDCDCHGRKE